MANIKSAKKRIKVTTRRRDENRGKKTELATAIKKFRALVTKREFDEASAFLPKVISLIDSGNVHGRLHKNTANRKKARLAEMLHKAMNTEEVVVAPKAKKAKPAPVVTPEVEVKEEVKAEVKEVEEKAPAKKPAAKKATAKAEPKTTAKKAPAKKPAAKKETAKAEPKAPAKKAPAKKPATKKEA